ncbi:PspC domain-containing protein [Roseateles violae]|uniref:PspC domain-containing protein n=1 Tax=Roseateles violae TaxID=3058042 RepID=A0ABT8DZG9_9BURK|nr:PspC domain-containing protein [Pelomonas sp. PFR6]MDN3922959.1 PspC domain-containing protein [Pelomonas sp. PFR6]
MSDSEELEKLAALHRSGALSDEEFARAKARVLGTGPTASAAAAGDAAALAGLNGLRRSRSDRWLGGVCGGIAQATGVAAWLWRLLACLLAVCAGSGVLLYLLLWIFVPEE